MSKKEEEDASEESESDEERKPELSEEDKKKITTETNLDLSVRITKENYKNFDDEKVFNIGWNTLNFENCNATSQLDLSIETSQSMKAINIL